jgi:pyruvate/2-oxoglutarate dehydrogenase complex dihydrolipoamide acyltransferase (E2) component
MTLPATASFADFARLAGYKRSYVTQLKIAGRLVLTDDGKQVRVTESLGLIESTRDPSRAGVAARHAAGRQAAEASPPAPPTSEGEGEGETAPDGHASRRSRALADKEEALARKALREEALELGQLMVGEEVLGVVSAAMVALRVRLENLPADLAPVLAAVNDEARVRTLLSEEIDSALRELSTQLAALAKESD